MSWVLHRDQGSCSVVLLFLKLLKRRVDALVPEDHVKIKKGGCLADSEKEFPNNLRERSHFGTKRRKTPV
jgi:hypothetical protein